MITTTIETGMGIDRIVVRAARGTDLRAAIALVDGANPHRRIERIGELLTDAIREELSEYRAQVSELNGRCVGVAVYGDVAGAVGTVSLYAVIVAPGVNPIESSVAMVAQILEERRSAGARLMVAEAPGDEKDFMVLLEAAGFAEESRVDDYYEDGVPLVQYRLELN